MMGIFARFRRRQDGVSAVEFALVAPIILLLLAAAVDFGSVVMTRMQIEDAAQSAMTYAMGQGQPLEAANAATLAGNVERILVSRLGSDVNLQIDVNHGAVKTYADATSSKSGNSALAASCYCPTMSSAGMQWNTALACSKPCTGGGGSGKFVYLRISKPFSPLFGSYGLIEDGFLRLQTIGRIQ